LDASCALLQITLAKHPILRPKPFIRQEESDFFRGFVASFCRIACLARGRMDSRWSLGAWLDEACTWCQKHQIDPGRIEAKNWFAALDFLFATIMPFSG
jgi:hypothetical protein